MSPNSWVHSHQIYRAVLEIRRLNGKQVIPAISEVNGAEFEY
jgi:hypothetical protein